MLVTKQLLEAIYFYRLEVKGYHKCLVTNILQNIIFCVQYTGLKQLDDSIFK